MKKSDKYDYFEGKQITDPDTGKRVYEINSFSCIKVRDLFTLKVIVLVTLLHLTLSVLLQNLLQEVQKLFSLF